MGDEQRSFTVHELARQLGGRVTGPPEVVITGLAALSEAQAGDLTFITDSRYAHAWSDAQASAALVTDDVAIELGDEDRRPLIIVPDAGLAMASALELFSPAPVQPVPGVNATADVHPTATLGADVRIGPHVSVGARCRVGDRVVLHAGVRLYDDVGVGADSVIHGNAVVRERCRIGARVEIHSNVSIGTDGFGFRPAPDGRGLVKMPHIGGVRIEDDVEIGANSCVDRGKFGMTVVGQGTKIDNLVQIAHNCRIGRCCLIAARTAMGGSATLGDGVAIGGGAGIADHVRIGDGVRLAAFSGVKDDIPPGEKWAGVPAMPASDTLRQWAAIRKLPRFVQRVSGLLRAQERQARAVD